MAWGKTREPEGDPLSVGQITRSIQAVLQTTFDRVKVVGEISDLARPRSGHIYLTLKDHDAQLRAVMWRSTAERLQAGLRDALADGLEVVAWGRIDVYPPRGAYQLIIDGISTGGIGALERAFRKLRDKLAAEGLFEPQWKQPLPSFPQRVGVITSPTAAALRDFLEVTRRRWGLSHIILFPVKVQGEGASSDVIEAIGLAHRVKPRPDLLVVTRGGGSIEDLWAFNEEPLVRAVFRSEIPIVSAIGHEIDVTLTDLAADVRALTPSEAAERIFPSRDEVADQLDVQTRRLVQALKRRAQQARMRLSALEHRPVLRRPLEVVRLRQQRLDEWQARLARAGRTATQRDSQRVAALAQRLEALNPTAVLARGYSITLHEATDRVIVDAGEVEAGALLRTIVARGQFESRVTESAPRRGTSSP